MAFLAFLDEFSSCSHNLLLYSTIFVMKQVSLILLVLGLLSCNIGSQETDNSELDFMASFPFMELASTDTLDCSALEFGTHLTGDDSPVILNDSLIASAIAPDILERAYFESGSLHYALAKFSFIEGGLEAYVIGEFTDAQSYRTQLFLFDPAQSAFIQTHSLSYVLGGGTFMSKRNAWLTDINQDGVFDVVYRRDEVDETEESIVYEDRLHTETWEDGNFIDHKMEDVTALESVFVVNEGI